MGEYKWLKKLYQLVELKEIDAAINLLFNKVDDLFLAGKFKECDSLLEEIELENLDTNLLVGLLSITYAASGRLSYRLTLVENIENRLQILAPERVDALMGRRR